MKAQVENGSVLTDSDAREWLREMLPKTPFKRVRDWCDDAACFFVMINRQALAIYTVAETLETVEVYESDDAFADALLDAAEFYCTPKSTVKIDRPEVGGISR